MSTSLQSRLSDPQSDVLEPVELQTVPQPNATVIWLHGLGADGYDFVPVERHPASARVPIFLAHGNADPIVPVARGAASRDRLAALDHPVQWHEYPMPHSVCADEIRDIAAFLQTVLR